VILIIERLDIKVQNIINHQEISLEIRDKVLNIKIKDKNKKNRIKKYL
jgi:hypothetical protein